ncbi:hypothetical protein T484DRAFT_1839349 [Baffinella frigidus]|nr:hypothetical protein T484DRAFT_1839349 [Cryptophyta sp. CCMP2293]
MGGQFLMSDVNKYVVMNPVFDVREYIATQELYTNQVQPRDATMILFNADLFKLRSSDLFKLRSRYRAKWGFGEATSGF